MNAKQQDVIDRGAEALAVALEAMTEVDATPLYVAETLLRRALDGDRTTTTDRFDSGGRARRVRIMVEVEDLGPSECPSCGGSGERYCCGSVSRCWTCDGSGIAPADSED